MNSKNLTFVIPAFNEEKTIGKTLEELKKSVPSAELLVVNDGSADKTKEIALKKGATVLTHLQNRGLGAALATGIQAAVKTNASIIVTFDADLQHTAEDVQTLITPIIKNQADAVIGSRFLRKEDLEMMPFSKVIGNRGLTFITNLFSGTKITDSQSGLRAFNKEAAKNLSIFCDRYEVSSEIINELAKRKFIIKEVPIKARYDSRSAVKGTNIKSGFEIFLGLLLKTLRLKK